jgi:hypothetical protein
VPGGEAEAPRSQGAGQAEHARLEENTKEALFVVHRLECSQRIPPFSGLSVVLSLSGLGTWGILLLPIWAVVVRLFLV